MMKRSAAKKGCTPFSAEKAHRMNDKRTVMKYFIEPIIKGFGESLKEKS